MCPAVESTRIAYVLHKALANANNLELGSYNVAKASKTSWPVKIFCPFVLLSLLRKLLPIILLKQSKCIIVVDIVIPAFHTIDRAKLLDIIQEDNSLISHF